MSNVIEFLDRIGRNPMPTAEAYAASVAALDADAAEREALLARDADALNDLLGGRPVMRCAVFEPSRQPDQEPDGDVPDGDEEEQADE